MNDVEMTITIIAIHDFEIEYIHEVLCRKWPFYICRKQPYTASTSILEFSGVAIPIPHHPLHVILEVLAATIWAFSSIIKPECIRISAQATDTEGHNVNDPVETSFVRDIDACGLVYKLFHKDPNMASQIVNDLHEANTAAKSRRI